MIARSKMFSSEIYLRAIENLKNYHEKKIYSDKITEY